jgi:hypothetical protein
MSRVPRMLACMIEICSPLARVSHLSAIVVFAALLYNPSPGLAQAVAPSLGSASTFALLAGTAVTCTNSTVTGDVGVWPGSAVTQVICPVVGTVHAGDGAAQQAYLDFISAYNELRDSPPPCDATLTGTLAGEVLLPGVYCVDDVAKTGTLTLDAGTSGANAVWLFLVDGVADHALTGTNFNVVMINGGEPCNVYWWVKAAATLTTSNFLGTILAGAAITVTGGTFDGRALATAAATLTTGAAVSVCEATSSGPGEGHGRKGHRKCNQGVGNGPENCDPGNSNQGDPSRSNDERGGTPGNPGRKGGNGK